MSAGRGPGFPIGVAVGGTLGAALGLLLAPRSGEETRRKIAAWREAQRARRPAEGGAVDAAIDLGLSAVAVALERIETAYSAARLAADEARQKLQAEWEARRAGGGRSA